MCTAEKRGCKSHPPTRTFQMEIDAFSSILHSFQKTLKIWFAIKLHLAPYVFCAQEKYLIDCCLDTVIIYVLEPSLWLQQGAWNPGQAPASPPGASDLPPHTPPSCPVRGLVTTDGSQGPTHSPQQPRSDTETGPGPRHCGRARSGGQWGRDAPRSQGLCCFCKVPRPRAGRRCARGRSARPALRFLLCASGTPGMRDTGLTCSLGPLPLGPEGVPAGLQGWRSLSTTRHLMLGPRVTPTSSSRRHMPS